MKETRKEFAMRKVIEHNPNWRVYKEWNWGNDSELVGEFSTKKDAEKYIKNHGKAFGKIS
jgi:hypothetical protein